jgi:hypothetical protein
MKFASYLLIAASAVALTGCSDLVSLNPFVTAQDAVIDPTLAGTWKNPDDGALYVIQQDGSTYTITYSSDKDHAKFEGRLMKVGDAEILDLLAEDNDGFRVPVHVAARVWPEGSTLRWAFLDSKWLREQAAQLPTRAKGDGTMLMATPEAVHAFLLKFAADPKSYEGNPTVLAKQ